MVEKISVAPMVDRTTNHFRNFIRFFNTKSTLYTEMITDKAIINGDSKKLLEFDKSQHNIVLQIASSNFSDIKKAAKIFEKYDYDEININAGCPSNRVSDNMMGAYLMSDIKLLKELVLALKEESSKKISIKHRIGIDGRGFLSDNKVMNTYEKLLEFVDELVEIGINKFIIHARIAILKGLNPHENRTIPPLDYEMVYKLKKDRPNLEIEINGGIKTLEEASKCLEKVDRVMMGRAIYDNPMVLNSENISRIEILEKLIKYVEKVERPYHTTMHTLGLFYATKYSKLWKQVASNSNVTADDIKQFMNKILPNL